MKGKVIAILVLLGIIGGIYTIMSLTKVGQGEVGVVYSMKNGVKEEVLTPGYHFVAPLDKVTDFPVSQQQLVLSNNEEDYKGKDKSGDWSVEAPSNGGVVTLNFTVNYNFLPDRVTDLYKKFNGMDGSTIVDSMVRNSIIAYIKEVTPNYTVMDIYNTKRAEVGAAVTDYLNEKLTDEYGINVSSALIIDVQMDETLKAKIQDKEAAAQDAEKAKLDKQTAIAQAETDKVIAESKAAVTVEEAKGKAESNRIISESITEPLIRMKEIEARIKHGWVTVQGADAVVVDGK